MANVRRTGPNPAQNPAEHGPEADLARPDTFRLRPAVGLRMIGIGCLWLAAAVLLEALRSIDALDSPVLLVLRWICVAVFAVIAVAGAIALLGRPRLVLSATGFRNRTARPGQLRHAAWTDVADVRHGPQGTLLISLSDGRTSRVLVALLDAPAGRIEAAIQDRLNQAHGYRPI
ncbi:hypothetical protein [Flindersiella endophytica]